MEKKKIQVGITCHLDEKGKKIKSEPIYRDWTPELQQGYDNMLTNFAKAIIPSVQEFYKDPKHVAEYEEWLKNYKKKF